MSGRVTVAAGPDGRPVARKAASSVADAELLRHEARLLERARHPSVVELVGLEDDGGGGVVLATAWVGSRRVTDLGPVATEEAAGLAAALATVVADLHDLGIVHGRVEPDHVLVAAGGRPVLCGLAGGGAAGAPPHPSATPPSSEDPAHPWGTPLSPAADVHGLGTVLHAVLGGEDGGAEPIPDRRFTARRSRWRGYQRRALQTLADQATADEPVHRPTARSLAAAVQAAVPDARLPAATAAATGTVLGGLLAEPPPADHVEIAAPPPGAASPGPAPAVPPPAPGSSPPSDPVEPGTAGAPGTSLEPLPRSSPRSVAAVAAAAVGLALLAGGARVVLAGDPDRPSLTVAATPTSAPPACGDLPPGPVADVDGDGCPAPVRVDAGGVVTVADARFAVGAPGDVVVVGDWDCDGQSTPLAVRPATGEVFAFSSWAPAGDDVTVRPVAHVTDGATAVVVDEDADGCDAVAVGHQPDRRAAWPEGET